MAFYEPLPDPNMPGFLVDVGGGRKMPMMISEEQLQGMGFQRAPPAGPDMRLAEMGGYRPPGEPVPMPAIEQDTRFGQPVSMPAVSGDTRFGEPVPMPTVSAGGGDGGVPGMRFAPPTPPDPRESPPPGSSGYTGVPSAPEPERARPTEGNARLMEPSAAETRARPAGSTVDEASQLGRQYTQDLLNQRGSPATYVEPRPARTVQSGKGPTAGTVKALHETWQQQDAALRAEYMAREETAKTEAVFTREARASKELELYSQQRRLGEIQSTWRDAMVDIKTKQSEAGAMRINPEKIWEGSGGGWRKVLAAIGIALGGGVRGGNPALQIVQGAIDDSIAAQQANMEQANQGVSQAHNYLNSLIQQGYDPVLARGEVRILMNELVAAKSLEMAAKSKVPEVLAAGDQIALAKKEENLKLMGEYETNAQPTEVVAQGEVRGGYVGGSGPPSRGEAFAKGAKLAEDARKMGLGAEGGDLTGPDSAQHRRLTKETHFVYTDPRGGKHLLYSPGATEARTFFLIAPTFRDNIATLTRILQKPLKSLSPKEIGDAEAAASALKLDSGKLYAQGAITGGEQAIYESLNPVVTDLFRLDASSRSRMRVSLRNLEIKEKAHLAQAYTSPVWTEENLFRKAEPVGTPDLGEE
jgi:hypothetical protein